MTKQVKNNITQLKIDQKIKQNELRSSKATYDSYLSQQEDIELSIKNFKKNKKADIDNLKESIQENKDLLKTQKENKKLAEQHIKKLKPQPYEDKREEKNEKSGELSILQYENKKLEKDNKYLDDNTTCIYCGTEITKDHKNKHLKQNLKRISENETKITSLITEIEDLNKLH